MASGGSLGDPTAPSRVNENVQPGINGTEGEYSYKMPDGQSRLESQDSLSMRGPGTDNTYPTIKGDVLPRLCLSAS